MIPEHDPAPRPPLTLEYAFLLALVAPLLHLLWAIMFVGIGFKLPESQDGMAVLITYGGIFALCAARFRQPPARQLGFVAPPLSACLAVLFLAPTLVLTSELNNVLKALLPPTPVPALAPELVRDPRVTAAALAVLSIGVYPLVYGVFFRGVLQPLATSRLGVVPGVLLTALMAAFGSAFLPALLSGSLVSRSPVLLDALVLCVLRQCAGSLYPALALQALWGAAAVAASYQLFGLAGFDAGGSHTPISWVAGAAVLTGVGLALCRNAARASTGGSSSPAQG